MHSRFAGWETDSVWVAEAGAAPDNAPRAAAQITGPMNLPLPINNKNAGALRNWRQLVERHRLAFDEQVGRGGDPRADP